MSHDLWHTEPNGILASENGSIRMTVQKFDQCARYLVLCRSGDDTQPYVLTASGTHETVRGAMKAAIARAVQLDATGGELEPDLSVLETEYDSF